ncbi:MAG: cation transporter, partial [Nitriliruptorales bacterium]|nr:cation transporter [Nitriliruptorales bacterium]
MTTSSTPVPSATGVIELDFDVAGMTCGACSARVQKTLEKQDGVQRAEVNLATHRAVVQVAPGATDATSLQEAIERIGYELVPHRDTTTIGDEEEAARRDWGRRVVASWPPAIAVMLLSMVFMDFGMSTTGRWLQFGLTVPVQFVVGWPFLREAAKRARTLSANMDTLIALGTLAAFSYSTVVLLTG